MELASGAMSRFKLVLLSFLVPTLLYGCTGILGSFEVLPTDADAGGGDSSGGTDSPINTDTGPGPDTAPPPVTLTVKKDGLGQGLVNSVPAGINCGTKCSESFAKGTTIALTATPVAPSIFGGWAGACNGKADCLITLDQAKDVTATFNQPGHVLTIRKTGSGAGVVFSNPTGITCGPNCDAQFPTNTVVKLTANPTGNAAFIGWNGGGCTGPQLTCDVTVTAAVTVEAEFAKPVTWDPAWSEAGLNFTNGDLSISSGVTVGTHNARTTNGRDKGKFYWEVKVTAGDPTKNHGGIGVMESAFVNNAPYIGVNGTPSGMSWGYAGNPTYFMFWAGAALNGQPPATSYVKAGDTYMFAIDLDAHLFWGGTNGVWYNAGDPANGANPAMKDFTGTVYPGITFYPNSGNAFTANFGQNAFTYTPPAGFKRGFY